MPELPNTASISQPPQCVCEVLSPSTAALDRTDKMDVYAREAVDHVWLVDADERLLEVFRLDGATYRRVGAFRDDAAARAEPFDAVELELGALWERLSRWTSSGGNVTMGQ
jgi:Uma2 family endonuclease